MVDLRKSWKAGDPDRDGPKISEIRLDGLEAGVESATFLASFASVFLLIWVLVLPVMAAAGRGNSGEPFWLVLSFSSAFGLIFFLSSAAISHVWRAPLLLGVIVTGGTLPAYPILQLLERNDEFDWPITIIFVLTVLLTGTFAIQIIWDGWRLARSSEENRKLLATIPDDEIAVRQTCAHALGIHPICRWLPGRSRRVLAGSLFALTTAVLAVALGLAMFLVLVWLSAEGPVARNVCTAGFSVANSPVPCAITLVSATAGPAIVIAVCLAGVAGLRWLARRSARLSLETLSRTDARPAVLFLRSFIDDQVQLALPKRPPYRRLLAMGEPRPRLDHILIEEATPVGPVIAIGLPGRPPPFGAARAYFHDDEWKSAVAELAAAATAIVIVIDDTNGVSWELGHIREAGFSSKTLYLLPPRLSGHVEAARLVRREFAEASTAHGAAVAAAPLAADPSVACIGWYYAGPRDLKILTTRTSTSTSYVCALRLALRPRSDRTLADLSFIERPQVRATTRARWIEPVMTAAMLAALAAVVWLQVPSRTSARGLFARAQLTALATALEQYRFDVGQYPTRSMGLHSLIEAPPRVDGWSGPYIAGDAALLDPWGRPYIYRVPGAMNDFDIVSLGRDGRPGGSGEDADITNWK
jgi:general secretion pathway protein G